ncbi:MAG: 30S ribosome-binding factor RbfA [Candidatus Sungbacteria bacterium]|nr:30S ribosome-binding factor RbfA [Candidatus Sungbacteria bacterium]
MASGRRIEKIQNLLREVIAATIARELAFPEGTMVTVTRVTPSEDLYYATVFVTILAAAPPAEREVLKLLQKATGAVQRALNRKLRMRPVPRIAFAVDQDEKRRERIEKLLGENGPGA